MLEMLLYYVLIIDRAVLTNKESTHVLVRGRMVQEVLMCVVAMMSMTLMFRADRVAMANVWRG